MDIYKYRIKDFIGAIGRHDLLTLAAALSFYTALSLAPLLLLSITIVSLLGFDMREAMLSQIQYLVGTDASETVRAIIESSKENQGARGVAAILGVGMLVISATSVFSQLQDSLNHIWTSMRVEKATIRGWLKKRLLSFGMLITLAFLSIVSLFVSTLLSMIFTQENVWQTVNIVASFAIFASVFAVLFKIVPDAKMNWKNAFIGGALTAVLFTLGKYLIGLYLGQSAVGSAYGAAGSLVIFLVWVYYSSMILFIGAELTRALTLPMPQES